MAAIQKKKVYAPLNGGLNDTLSPVLLNDNEAAELINCRVSDRAVLEKIEGYSLDHQAFPDDSNSFLRLLVNYRRGTTVNDLIMAATDEANTNATYKVDLKKTSGTGSSSYLTHTAGTSASFTNGNTAVTGVGTSWLSHLKAGDKIKAASHSDTAYTEIATVVSDTSLTLVGGGYTGATAAGVSYTARIILSNTHVPAATVFNDSLIIVNGSEKPMTWNNTTLNKITDADCPTAKYVTAHKSRVFMASPAGAPSKIYWSAVNNEQSWDAAANEDIFPQDNGTIIAIKSFGDSLIVLKNNGKIYQVLGNFDQDDVGEVDYVRLIDSPENIGTIASRSVVVHEGFLYFLSETGLYAIDPRMAVQKVTRNADTAIGNVLHALGPTENKSHVIEDNDDWDAGTYTRTRKSAGYLESIFDKYTISDARQVSGLMSSAVDSSGTIHVAYVSSSNSKVIKYASWTTAGVATSETAVTSVFAITELSLDVSASGKVGIAYTVSWSGASALAVGFVERSGGTWGSEETVDTNNGLAGGDATFVTIAFRYNSSNQARIIAISDDTSLVAAVPWAYKRTGVGSYDAAFVGNITASRTSSKLTLELNASDYPAWAWREDATTIKYASHNADFPGPGTFNSNEYKTVTNAADIASNSRIYMAITSGGVEKIVWGESGVMKIRNMDTDTTTTLSSASDRVLGFTLANSDKSHMYYINGSGTESFVYDDSTTVTNSTTATISTSALYTGDTGFSHNSQVFGSCAWGANANEIVVRRLAFSGNYISSDYSDSSLVSWGTYLIGDETTNGNTVTHYVAVSPIANPSSYNAITNGQVVSTDSASVVAKVKITFSLGTFAKFTTSSVTLNYTGAGVDATSAFAVSFKNQLYIATSQSGDTANTLAIILDEEGKIIKAEYPIAVMEVYRNRLYGGLSTSGKLVQLVSGYSMGGSSYGMDFQSKEDFLEGIELEKDVYKYYVLYEVKNSGTFTFSYRLDNFATAGGSTWQTTSVDMTTAGVAEIPVGNKCRSIQFRITDSSSSATPVILGVVLVYGTLNIR